MSYTYPEALAALESIANDYIKLLKPHTHKPVFLVCDVRAATASVVWDGYSINVTMPVRPAVSTMTQAEFEDWTAYLLHELGHPTHTDLATWQTAVKAGHANMTNALEDVRMEKALIASGIVPNAKAVLSRLVSRKVAEARVNGWKPNARREIAWTLCVLGRAANGYAIDASDLAWIKSQIQPGSTVETVLAWALPALATCHSTADCLAIAERIGAAIATPQQPQPQQPGKGQASGEAQDEGEGESDQDSPAQEQRASDDDNAPEGPSAGNEGEGEGEGEGKGGKGHGDGTTNSDETPVLSDDDLADHDLSPEGDAMKPSADAHTEKAVLDILRDKAFLNSTPNGMASGGRLGVTGTRLRDAAAKASRQRALLARALRANETDEREGGRKAGRLDRGALTRAAAGASNVFARREIQEGFDTDVCILLDASGSMGGECMFSAVEAGLIVAQAASSVGAPSTTETFNSTGYLRAGSIASKRAPNIGDFGTLARSSTGGTPLSSHMARVAKSQALRAPHKRRVVFVITDGGCDYGTPTVKRMATYLEQAYGTVFAHVSIHTPLQGAFKAEVVVPYGKSVADVGLEHFVKVLQAL